MQSGVITKDTFTQIFRGISQRRQQGTMELHCQDTLVKVQFIQGKIVDAVDGEQGRAQPILQVLTAAGYLEPGMQSAAQSYRELFEEVSRVSKRPLDESLFKQIIRHRVLDRLYALDFGTGSYFTFKIEMVDCDRELAPNISVGQLLLDYVALETEMAQFKELFESGQAIVHTPNPKSGVSAEEELVYDLIGQGISLQDLALRSMLSRYHLQEALLGLHKAGLITTGEIQTPAAGTTAAGPTSADDIFAALDQSIDAAFAAETGAEAVEPKETATADDAALSDSEQDLERPSLQVRLGVKSMQLLHVTWIPHAVTVAIAVVGLLGPFLFWGDLFRTFREL
jgi:hypothetical protein